MSWVPAGFGDEPAVEEKGVVDRESGDNEY